MTIERVAVLGLGTMGAGMAQNLLESAFVVRGYNRTRARAEALRPSGLEPRARPEDAVTGADAVLTCVADDAALEAMVFESGVLDSLERGAALVDCGTTGLELTARLAEACRAREVDFVDAPVTGSKLGAEGGKLTFMVGGPKATVERLGPLFGAMGRHVVHAGERVGDGQRIKYCLNMTQAIVLEGVLEGYALARAQGLSIEALSEVFEHSAGKTGVGSFKTPYLLSGDLAPHFRLDLMQKDLHLALEEAGRARLPLALARAVTTLYDQAARRGFGAEDFLATARLLDLVE
jgi:3-hydroxyisobutyrate dehydrogenase-like beta-hydroxyacid dehydrogenase